MSLGRSGFADLVATFERYRSSEVRRPAPASSTKAIVHLSHLRLEDFSPALRPFVRLEPLNRIDRTDVLQRKFIENLHRLPLRGYAAERDFDKGVFCFRGVTLGDFVAIMAEKTGKENVFILMAEDIYHVRVVVRIPGKGSGAVPEKTFFFEAKRHGMKMDWSLILGGNGSSVVSPEKQPDLQCPDLFWGNPDDGLSELSNLMSIYSGPTDLPPFEYKHDERPAPEVIRMKF